MKITKYLFITLLTILFSCNSDNDSNPENNSTQITVSTSNFSVTIDEGLPSGTIIGTINASTNEGNVIFSIQSQNPDDSFEVDSQTGELTILDSDNFDYELNTQITGVVQVSNGDILKTSNVTISLNDIEEEKIFVGDVVLKTQQEVDNFGDELYIEVTGCLDIQGYITSLIPLQSLKKVGSLSVDCPILVSLEGLNNLIQINNDLRIMQCHSLINVDQFSNITSLNGVLVIFSNSKLISLAGLANIDTIGGRFNVASNEVLTSLEGINLVSVGGNFKIDGNPLLNNISSLSSLTFIGGDMQIYRGIFTNLNGLNNLNTVGGNIDIRDTSLTNLHGLDNLNTINGFWILISSNHFLLTLEGLGNNISFGSTTASIPTTWITIENNSSLIEIDALENISSFYFPPKIIIVDNGSLTNVDGLVSVSSSIKIKIKRNNNLINLDGLQNLVSLDWDLEVENNTILSNLCGISTLLQNNGIEGDYIVSGNLYNPTEQDILDGNCQE